MSDTFRPQLRIAAGYFPALRLRQRELTYAEAASRARLKVRQNRLPGSPAHHRLNPSAVIFLSVRQQRIEAPMYARLAEGTAHNASRASTPNVLQPSRTPSITASTTPAIGN